MNIDEGIESHGPGCCCCSCGLAVEDSYVEPAYADVSDVEPFSAEAADFAPAEVVVETDIPVESVESLEPVVPVTAPAPVESLEPVVPVTAPAPVRAVELGTIGGTDPYGGMTIVPGPAVEPAAGIIGGSMTIGGTDPYGTAATVDLGGSMTIGGTDPYGATPGDTQALQESLGTIGGPTPLSQAAADVAAYTEALDQMSPQELLAAAGYTGSAGATEASGDVTHDLAMQPVIDQLLREKYLAERGLNDTMSPLYHSGDDIDPSSPYYSGRP